MKPQQALSGSFRVDLNTPTPVAEQKATSGNTRAAPYRWQSKAQDAGQRRTCAGEAQGNTRFGSARPRTRPPVPPLRSC